MPELDLSVYEKLPPIDLEAKRAAIVKRANGRHDNLSIEELHELAAITTVLRRRTSGPPKAKGAKTKPPKPTILDLA